MLTVSVCLPWFQLPILGWQIPTPGWSRAGLACLLFASLFLFRMLTGYWARWLLRAAILPSLYFWFKAPAGVKAWAAYNLAPTQLKLAPVNQALSSLGGETISLYEPVLWRALQPQFGWYLAGASLGLALLYTLLDGPICRKCLGCAAELNSEDAFCASCGTVVGSWCGCTNCGHRGESTDRFCRRCGQEMTISP